MMFSLLIWDPVGNSTSPPVYFAHCIKSLHGAFFTQNYHPHPTVLSLVIQEGVFFIHFHVLDLKMMSSEYDENTGGSEGVKRREELVFGCRIFIPLLL